MKIVHVTHGRPRPDSANGVDKVVYHLAKQQTALGHDVSALAFSSKPPLEISGVKSITLPAPRVPLRVSEAAMQYLLRFQPDLVHFHSVLTPPNTMLGRSIHKNDIPYIVTPHGALNPHSMRHNRFQKTAYFHLFEKRFLSQAAAIHAVAEEETHDLRRLGIATSSFLVPNGVDIAHIPTHNDPERIRHRLPDTTGKRIFLFLGRLAIDHKGLDLLIEAIALAKDDLQDALFVIAGPDIDGSQAQLRQLTAQHGIEALLCFPGAFFDQDKYDLMALADVFLHPSRWEGHPTGMLEAMAFGLPCIATVETNLGAAIQTANAGFVMMANTEAIAAGLRAAMAQNGEKLEEMGDRGREAARQDFGWEEAAELLANQYRPLLSRS